MKLAYCESNSIQVQAYEFYPESESMAPDLLILVLA